MFDVCFVFFENLVGASMEIILSTFAAASDGTRNSDCDRAKAKL